MTGRPMALVIARRVAFAEGGAGSRLTSALTTGVVISRKNGSPFMPAQRDGRDADAR